MRTTLVRILAVVVALSALTGRAHGQFAPAPGLQPGGGSGIEAKVNILTNVVGYIVLAGAEFAPPMKTTTFEVLAGAYGYDVWDGSYNEWGGGFALSVLARFYTAMPGAGPYTGAGITYIDGGFDWYDSGSYGWGYVSGIAPTVIGGYKMRLPNSPVTIDYNGVFAYILGADSDLSIIFGAGVAIGVTY